MTTLLAIDTLLAACTGENRDGAPPADKIEAFFAKRKFPIVEGSAVIPGALSSDIVRSFDPGAVEVEVSGDEVSISSGRSQFSVRTLPVEEYPKMEMWDSKSHPWWMWCSCSCCFLWLRPALRWLKNN